jgi:methylmalonyl-CoA/ethylmalonyl-CoA epimerase
MSSCSLASHFTQASYVVRDIDTTAQWFRRALGVEFHAVRSHTLGGPDYPITAGGKSVAAQVGIKLALAKAGARGELEIELIQPDGGDSIFSRFVERRGGGLHHVAFEVPSFDAASEGLRGEGISPHAVSRGGNKFAYFDCRGAGAAIIEVAQFDEETRMEHQQLKSPPGTESASDPNAPRFVQISYVVSDVAAVAQWFKRAIGVEYFGVSDAVAGGEYEVKVRDQPVTTPFTIRTAMGRLGPRGEQEIEIIQPVAGDSPYREFIDQYGDGLNHVSFLVPDFEAAADRMRATGMKPLVEFRGYGIRACYFDCRAAGASIVELAHCDARGTKLMERMKTPRA